MSPLLHIVLLHPEIPNNTGSVGRTVAVTGCRLHVIHPIGFSMDDTARKRAGLDYWDKVDCVEHQDWDAYLETARPKRLWLFTARPARPFWEATFEPGDHLLFGRESDGVPQWTRDWVDETWGPDHRLTLPQRPEPGLRSLNLSNVVATATYEAVRQIGPEWV